MLGLLVRRTNLLVGGAGGVSAGTGDGRPGLAIGAGGETDRAAGRLRFGLSTSDTIGTVQKEIRRLVMLLGGRIAKTTNEDQAQS